MALHHHDLLDPALHAHTHSQIENDNILLYYIHDETSSFILGGHQTSTLEHHPESELFIDHTLHQLDSLIDLDLARTNDQNEADIRIYSVLNHSGWEQNTVGQVIPDDKGWSTLWKNTSQSQSLSDFDANTIIHELGHAFGLSHPGGSGDDQRWTTADSVMSYNPGPEGWNSAFSTNDQQALLHLWGIESDPVEAHEHPDLQPANKDETETVQGLPAFDDTMSEAATQDAVTEDAVREDAVREDGVKDDADWTDGSFTQLLQGEGRANERVIGTSNNDVLVFGEGRDRLKGSAGSDLFLIPGGQQFTNRTADHILDFNGHAGDVISLVTQIPAELATVNFATATTQQDLKKLEENDTTVIHDAITNQLVHDMNAASPGLGDGGRFAARHDIQLKTINSKQQLKQLSQTEANMIYVQTKGQLFYDANGSEAGLGDGGLVAKLKGQPDLEASHLRLWAEVS